MENSKLIQLLKTFKAKELRECGEWVHSPIVNKNEELSGLYLYLKSCAPTFAAKKIERSTVYKKLFPKKMYDEKHLNHLMSFLLKLIEQYLAYSKFSENTLQENIYTLQSYTQRGLDKHYAQALESTKQKLQQVPFRNVDFYFHQYLLAETENQHFLKQKIRKFDERLQLAANHFDNYLLANKLKYFCEMKDRKMSLAANYELNMQSQIFNFIDEKNLDDFPGINVYRVILQMLEQPSDTQYFFSLKKLLKQHAADFPHQELKELYFYAINYCIRKVNQGEQDFLKELFAIYKDCLKENVLIEDEQMSPWTFKNLVGVGLRLKEFQWVEQFIKENNDLLSEEFRVNAYNYNMAELSYYRNDFDKAIKHLNKVEFSDVYYSFDTKKMLMKIYFEQDEIDALLSLIASFKIFIKRNNSVSEANKEAYNNFINIIQQFVKYASQNTAPELFKSIETTKPLADRNWLLEQYGKRFKN